MHIFNGSRLEIKLLWFPASFLAPIYSILLIPKSQYYWHADHKSLGAAIVQWLACWTCNPRVAGSILRSSSLSDETINRGPVSMTLAVSGTLNSNHSFTHKSHRFIFKTHALSRDKSANQYARAHLRGLISSKCLYPNPNPNPNHNPNPNPTPNP